MLKNTIFVSLLVFCLNINIYADTQENSKEENEKIFSTSFNVAYSSNYIWRGVSQNNDSPSLSGGFDLEAYKQYQTDLDDTVAVSITGNLTDYYQYPVDDGTILLSAPGANVWAAEHWLWENEAYGDAITILCDRGERYLSCI